LWFRNTTKEVWENWVGEKCCNCRCCNCRGVTSLWESLEISPSFLEIN
jgi:hypothetical protein